SNPFKSDGKLYSSSYTNAYEGIDSSYDPRPSVDIFVTNGQ
ncbi:5680_t:CDS:1, partial [Racocetra persica]